MSTVKEAPASAVRRRLLRTAAGLGVLVAFGAMAAFAPTLAASTLERAREQGYIRIAIANEPPYTEVKANGEVTGAAPEVTRAVMKKLGVPEILPTVTQYGAMIPGLQAGRFDIVSAGLFMKPVRCEAVLYSQPDVCGSEAFMIEQGNPLGVESYEDVADNPDAVIGVCGGCTEEMYAREAGTPDDRVVIVPDGPSGVKMLQTGRIDVYALPQLSLADLKKKTGADEVEIYSPVKGTPISCAGAAFRKSDRELRDAYDEVLAELKESGEFAEILEPFGFSAEAAKQVTRKELCGGPN